VKGQDVVNPDQNSIYPDHRLLGPNGDKPLILVVDDTPINLETLAEMVRHAGANARVANCGATALRYARLEPRPDLILLDIMMPDMDGHAVLAELRRMPETRDIPVIFVTALDDQSEEERGIREGAADYVSKPVKMSVLIARIRAHLEVRRAQWLLANQKAWLEQEVERRIAENTHLDRHLTLALERNGFGIWEHDPVRNRNRWSEGLRQMLGYEQEPEQLAESMNLIHPEDRPAVEAQVTASLRDRNSILIGEFRIRHHDGGWRWVESRGRIVEFDEAGQPTLMIGTMLDITERKLAEAEHRLADLVFTGIGEGICITDAKRNILRINDAFSTITGYQADEIVGQNPRLLKSGVHSPAFYAEIWKTIDQYGNWQGEITNRHKDGSLVTEWLSISSLRDTTGTASHYIGIFSDLSERQAAAERIQYLSSYDTLTELPNRHLFDDRLNQALLTARRFERGTALILLDLNRFRLINDTLGPPAGDEILVEVTRRLKLQVREGDTVGRRAGNEFGFVMANLSHERDALALAQRMLDAISVPFSVAGQSVAITASIGISVFPKNGENGEAMLRSADAALLRAKQSGRNTFSFYSPEMDADAARRLSIESALRDALARDEFCVHYQPQVSLDSGHMIGMEALLRWNSALLGPISPVEFIPIAEETGLIMQIGDWVLRTACHQTKAWLDLGLLPLHVAVNLSPRQFRQADLPAQVANALAESGLPAAALELEITESAFIDDIDDAVAMCSKLKSLGIKLSLDDFGTGYSSLAYVSRFPFDKIKIDQSFVRDIVNNPVNAAIASAAIVMGRSLNLSVLAEGVETEAQAAFLRSRRCDAIQGYLFSRPLPPEEFAPLLLSCKPLPIAALSPTQEQTLLLVDDEPNVLSSLTRLLRREGYAILTATSPTEAFDLLAKQPVQVVISDQRMPDMSGTEFLSRVRQLYPATIRLVLTGYTDLQSVTDAINRGAIYKFLTKPWDDDQLREQIREAFRVVHLNQEQNFIPASRES